MCKFIWQQDCVFILKVRRVTFHACLQYKKWFIIHGLNQCVNTFVQNHSINLLWLQYLCSQCVIPWGGEWCKYINLLHSRKGFIIISYPSHFMHLYYPILLCFRPSIFFMQSLMSLHPIFYVCGFYCVFLVLWISQSCKPLSCFMILRQYYSLQWRIQELVGVWGGGGGLKWVFLTWGRCSGQSL